jgi:hypothetical protein
MSELGAAPFLVLLVAAMTSSLVIAVLYQHYFADAATGTQLYRAFALLGLSITAIFVTVQFSLPLSIGLLAALSIVRFRTPIKEPEEIGVLMVVVAGSVASATFKLQFLAVLLASAFVALAFQRIGSRLPAAARSRRIVTVALPASQYGDRSSAVSSVVERHFSAGRLEGLATRAGEVVVSYSMPAGEPVDIDQLRSDLERQSFLPRVTVHLSRART